MSLPRSLLYVINHLFSRESREHFREKEFKNLQLHIKTKLRTTQHFGEAGGVALTSLVFPCSDNIMYQMHLVYFILHNQLPVFIILKC